MLHSKDRQDYSFTNNLFDTLLSALYINIPDAGKISQITRLRNYENLDYLSAQIGQVSRMAFASLVIVFLARYLCKTAIDAPFQSIIQSE